ncbi:hypothetical protein CEXT_444091 [Caerostris extrusa]|uniref:Uncharacterized protein n=1 Tax=Caerostris extrusa TaxID=172846 RepID=A0AAV4WZK5_CAEEX|nr:hypothetical protein CEXT_444091 [Caerostris extrusa]
MAVGPLTCSLVSKPLKSFIAPGTRAEPAHGKASHSNRPGPHLTKINSTYQISSNQLLKNTQGQLDKNDYTTQMLKGRAAVGFTVTIN